MSSGGDEGKEGGRTLCASQCSPIAHRGGGEPGTHGGQGGHPWGGAEAGGAQEEGEAPASPPPYTPVCMQTCKQTGEDADSRWKRRGG